MISEFKYDYIELLIGAVIAIAGVIQIIRYHSKFNFKEAFLLIFSGILILTVAAISNNLISNRWDMKFVIIFLSLQITGGWFPRGLAFLGYIFFTWGIMIFFIAAIAKLKKENF
jgi:hypothetical protein